MGAAEVARAAPILAVRFDGEALRAIDQTLLPWEYVELSLDDAAEVAAAIARLAIRGAPLIGVAAAYGVALELAREPKLSALHRACSVLGESRPTAVNLRYAIERVRNAALAVPEERMAQAALAEAHAMQTSEEAASAAMAANGAELLAGTRSVLTHCNSGALAAPGRGTALAVIAELADRGSLRNVLATETRPLLQGARLTAWELQQEGISLTLITDSMAGHFMRHGGIKAVFVGADRIAANGDVANKIGTYSIAVLAQAHSIPFYVVAPRSTIDLKLSSGEQIPI